MKTKQIILTIVISITLMLPVMAIAKIFNPIDPVGDKYWENRDKYPDIILAIQAYEKKLATEPQNVELLTRLSIAYYWKGNILLSMDKDEDTRKQAFNQGMEYGKKALAIDPQNIPANFWYTTNKGKYCNEVGVLKSLKEISDIRQRINTVMTKDKFYYYGGPQRYMAKLVCSVPGLMRKSLTGCNLEQAEKMLKEAIHYQPFFSLSYIYLADVYAKMKKPELSKEQLEKAAQIKETDLPEFAPEIRFYGKLSKQKLQEEFK